MKVTARLAAALAVAVLGCAGQPEPPSALRIGYQHALVSLDPHTQNDGVTGSVLSAVYETLVRLEPGALVRPFLAEQWTTPSDSLWRFKLRQGVRFHDGRAMTAADVVYSIRRARFDPQSQLATYMEAVEDVRTARDDEWAVEVKTSGPFPLLLSRMSMVGIVPADFDPEAPTGTGPYCWGGGEPEGPILLRRWQEYWGEAPDFTEVQIRVVENDVELRRLIENDELDVMARVSADFLSDGGCCEGWRMEALTTAASTILGINLDDPVLGDPRFREAVDLAIGRRELVETAFAEGVVRPALSLVPPEVFGFSPEFTLHPADPDRARQLLAAAGVRAGTTLRLDHSGVYQPVVSFLLGVFAEIGLEVEEAAHPYDVFYRRIEQGTNQIFLFGWTFTFADASDFLDAIVHTREPERMLGQLNGSFYSDERVDRWIEEAAREPRTKHRLELLRWSLARVARDRVYLPLYHRSRLALVREPLVIVRRSGSWVIPQDVRLP